MTESDKREKKEEENCHRGMNENENKSNLIFLFTFYGIVMVEIFLLHYTYVYKLYHSDLLMLIYFDSSSGVCVFFLVHVVLFALKWVENSKYVLLLIRSYLEKTDKIAVFWRGGVVACSIDLG